MKPLCVLAFAAASLLTGCSRSDTVTNQQRPTPTTAALITTLELREGVIAQGKAIARETFSLLSSNLQSALTSGGVTNALPYCSLAASPLTASVGEKYGVTLRRVTHRARNPKGKANAVEIAILDRYHDELGQGKVLNPVVTNLVEGTVTFFAPIVLTNSLCLKCHGELGKDILPEDFEVIRKLYPQDEAAGFHLGDLRGAWRIDFPASTLGRSRRGASH